MANAAGLSFMFYALRIIYIIVIYLLHIIGLHNMEIITINQPQPLALDTINAPDIAADFADFEDAQLSKGARRTYARIWRAFESFCVDAALPSMPAHPNTVWLYLRKLYKDGRAQSTIFTHLYAILRQHKDALQPSPCAGDTRASQILNRQLEGMRRKTATNDRRKAGAMAGTFDTLLAQMDAATPNGLRDAAMYVLALANACRRSEPVSLLIEDISWRDDRAEILLRSSKTDQTGQGAYLVAPKVADGIDPYTLLVRWVDWLKAQGIVKGALFRRIVKTKGQLRPVNTQDPTRDAITPDWYNRNLQRYANAAGIKTIDGHFSSHTLRATFVDKMNAAGYSTLDIANGGRWKSQETVRRYSRDNAAARAVNQVVVLK